MGMHKMADPKAIPEQERVEQGIFIEVDVETKGEYNQLKITLFQRANHSIRLSYTKWKSRAMH